MIYLNIISIFNIIIKRTNYISVQYDMMFSLLLLNIADLYILNVHVSNDTLCLKPHQKFDMSMDIYIVKCISAIKCTQ